MCNIIYYYYIPYTYILRIILRGAVCLLCCPSAALTFLYHYFVHRSKHARYGHNRRTTIAVVHFYCWRELWRVIVGHREKPWKVDLYGLRIFIFNIFLFVFLTTNSMLRKYYKLRRYTSMLGVYLALALIKKKCVSYV